MSSNENYVTATLDSSAFHCPLCGTYAHQYWGDVYYHTGDMRTLTDFKVSTCGFCRENLVWHINEIVVPRTSIAPMAHADIPAEIKADFEEARSTFTTSPRSASALLRLAVQKLCKYLGEKRNNLNDDIAALVKKGLP